MGLDGIELVMEFEDEFGITIPDEDAERLYTIGDAAAYVTALRRGADPKVPYQVPRSCDSSRAFYAWRRVLTARLDVDRRRIVPGARMRDLAPRAVRRDVWHAAAEAGIHVPGLQANAGLVMLVIAIGVTAGLQVALRVHVGVMFPTIFAVGAVGLWMLDLVRGDLPRGCSTVAGLVRASWVPPAGAGPCHRDSGPIDTEVLEKVLVIVSEQMGVPVQELTPRTRFAEDLGV